MLVSSSHFAIESRRADHVIRRGESVAQHASLRIERSPENAVRIVRAPAAAFGHRSRPARRESVGAAPGRVLGKIHDRRAAGSSCSCECAAVAQRHVGASGRVEEQIVAAVA